MEREDRRRADALDRHWDAFQRDPTVGRAADVDAVAEAVMMHLHHGPAAPPPPTHQRLRRQVTAHGRELENAWCRQARAEAALAPNVPPSAPARKMPWLAVPFATALLLLVVLAVGYVTLRSARSPADRPLSLPAIVAPAPPAIDTSGHETLASVTLPAGAVPTSASLDIIGWSAALDPGTATDAVPGCCRGPQIVHVLDGELTLRVDGPLQVTRATGIGAASDAVPADTAVVLNPGDSAIFDYALVARYANRASSPLHLVGGGLLAGWVRGAPAGLTLIDYNYEYPIPTISAGPVDVRLIRATLPPGGTIPVPPPGAIVIDVGGLADVDIGKGSDGALRNLGPTEATFYVLSVEPIGPAQGVTAASPAP